MSLKLAKRKLKRRGKELYNMYFFNSEDIINHVINNFDNGLIINDFECEVVFYTKSTTIKQIYELIMYYPNLLKEKNIITDEVINEIYLEYGETINIMNNVKGENVRGKLSRGCQVRAKTYNLPVNIVSEDIKLVSKCPLLNVSIEYGNSIVTPYSASIDKIDPERGYVKGNIQVVSMLANQMKSSANKTELLTFANNIIKLYS